MESTECPNCGTNLAEDLTNCPICGRSVGNRHTPMTSPRSTRRLPSNVDSLARGRQSVTERREVIFYPPAIDTELDDVDLLENLWERTKVLVGAAGVELDLPFRWSLGLWIDDALPFECKRTNRQGDLDEPLRFDGDAVVDIKGHCLADVTVAGRAVIHVRGDLEATLKVEGDAEIVIAGHLREGARLEIDGGGSLFLEGSLLGAVQVAGESRLWIRGNLGGRLTLGAARSRLNLGGDLTGVVAPTTPDQGPLALRVHGHASASTLAAMAERRFEMLAAVVRTSDVTAGMRQLRDGPSYWVVLQAHQS